MKQKRLNKVKTNKYYSQSARYNAIKNFTVLSKSGILYIAKYLSK